MDTMQEVTLAFKFSAKRLFVFKEQLGDNPVAREEMGRHSKAEGALWNALGLQSRLAGSFRQCFQGINWY